MMESPSAYPESPMEDDIAFPCKGCGQILEEGKAFELAGNRWHIDCFRCNTCNTLLDSDANLLLLGDGSLICNNCTYSCSSCGNKIEDLAILTGDQAFCANCFKCRNCKRKIENLRYARTSQGIFCMDCHESLMARRRKKTARNAAQRSKSGAGANAKLDKSLPSLPPVGDVPQSAPTPDFPTPQSEAYSETPTELPQQARPPMHAQHDSSNGIKRTGSPAVSQTRDNLTLPSNTFKNKRHSFMAQQQQQSEEGDGDEFSIPLAFDPTPPIQHSPQISTSRGPTVVNEPPRDYFNTTPSAKKAPGETPSSSHIAYQEKGRKTSGEAPDPPTIRREGGSRSNIGSPAVNETLRTNHQSSPKVQQASKDTAEEKFKLQEVPKPKRAGGSSRKNSRTDAVVTSSEPQTWPAQDNHGLSVNKTRETQAQTAAEHSKPSPMVATKPTTPRPSYEGRPRENGSIELSRAAQAAAASPQPPKRADSDSKPVLTIPRKEVGGPASRPSLSTQTTSSDKTVSPSVAQPPEPSSPRKLSSGKTISSPIESPKAKSVFDTSSDNARDPFAAPRAPPPAPPSGHARNESISTLQSENGRHDRPHSPALPRYSAGGQFSMDEDMARIMGGDGPNQESFLRRVSNSVRHGRSFSDKGMRLSKEAKWQKSPIVETHPVGQDISSPDSALPEHRDELSWYKNELRRERQKNLERDRKISELEAMVNSTADIKQANTELREKRSTIVVLDAQKEIVVRELEVLTEHIADSKLLGEPFDLNRFTNTALRDFGEALQKLRDSFAPKIEEAIQTRQDLVAEITKLVQMKEKSFQEFEQLSLKNAQLAELNNTLVHQIQNLYKANSTTKEEEKAPTNGLGIYSHHKDKSSVSVDSKEARPPLNETSSLGTPQTILQPEEAEPVTVLQGPQVVNIRNRVQARKFNWKKGGQTMAKGVTKGLKGAFSSTQQSYAREMQFTETQPYGSTPPGSEYSNLPKSSGSQQPNTGQKGFGFFGQPRAPGSQQSTGKMGANESSSALAVDASTTLFGADLEQRAEFEKTPIPHIITRCIEEVEMRGMDAEGIYRKSGGNSQILIVKEGFEKNLESCDISDPDLDIHAVTSCLKQYLRRLPIPLITYDVYDKLLDSMKFSTPETKVEAIQRAIIELPQVHQDVLEFLVFHLKRVVGFEKENLMTPTNIAVVFAPTIMRPESITREMSDTARKNETVQFIVEHCQEIFLGNH